MKKLKKFHSVSRKDRNKVVFQLFPFLGVFFVYNDYIGVIHIKKDICLYLPLRILQKVPILGKYVH